MSNLRFIMRDGVKVLQELTFIREKDHPGIAESWQDVPLVEGPKKAREFWLNMRDKSIHFVQKPYVANNEHDPYIKVREVLEGE